jgi:hypothetical protein
MYGKLALNKYLLAQKNSDHSSRVQVDLSSWSRADGFKRGTKLFG